MYKLAAKKIRPVIGKFTLGKYFEKKFIKKNKTSLPPPIFIVGLPRSGSTLLYQLICNHFRVGYFSNFSSVFIGYPSLVSKMTKFFHEEAETESYKSKYGVTSGFFAPSEAGGIYRYWFSNDSDVDDEHIRKTCYKMAEIYNSPFIWKNLNLSTEIERLAHIFPNALFVKMDRKIKYVVQSIYLKSANGDGIDIKGLEKQSLLDYGRLLEGIVKATLKFNGNLNDLINDISVNSITIDYEMICKDSRKALKRVEDGYAKTGLNIERKNSFTNKDFKCRNIRRLNEEKWAKLNHLLDIEQESFNNK